MKHKSVKKTSQNVNRYAKKTHKFHSNISGALTYQNYLSKVVILSNSQNPEDLPIQKFIMLISFGSIGYYNTMRNQISNVLPNKPKSDWVSCINKCNNITFGFISRELKSTAYYLRILSMSGIGDTKTHKFAFQIDTNNISKISGIWEHDYIYFKLIVINPRTSEIISEPIYSGKLIMGYGPSASGKTFSAGKVIELMRLIDPLYPTWFLSIDGGIYREQSLIYQTIISLIQQKGQYAGLSNLVSASFFSGHKTIFDSNIVKSSVRTYLLHLKETLGISVNLYVPETAGGCVKYINCQKTYQEYVNITGDKNWSGLLIYQHKTHKDCIYPDKYKCSGTIESGKNRQVLEGKKYSSSTWANSMRNSEYLINKAPIFRFKIHNSGSPNRITMLDDLSPHPQVDIVKRPEFIKFLKRNNWEYSISTKPS